MIRQWRPWEKSTGPKTDQGKATSAANRKDEGVRKGREDMRLLRSALRQYDNAMDGLDFEQADRIMGAVADKFL